MRRRFLSIFLLMAGLVAAGGANSTPFKWTLSDTTFSGFPGTITSANMSGTFVYDAETTPPTVSNVNVTVVLNGTSYLITSSAPIPQSPFSEFLVFTNTVANGAPTGWVNRTRLVNADFSGYNMDVAAGLCLVANGSCFSSNYATGTAILTGVPRSPSTNSIPTLSEWAQIIMMLAMIATAGFYGRRMKQR